MTAVIVLSDGFQCCNVRRQKHTVRAFLVMKKHVRRRRSKPKRCVMTKVNRAAVCACARGRECVCCPGVGAMPPPPRASRSLCCCRLRAAGVEASKGALCAECGAENRTSILGQRRSIDFRLERVERHRCLQSRGQALPLQPFPSV